MTEQSRTIAVLIEEIARLKERLLAVEKKLASSGIPSRPVRVPWPSSSRQNIPIAQEKSEN